jgi:purine-binding chemotaxis protein CheW
MRESTKPSVSTTAARAGDSLPAEQSQQHLVFTLGNELFAIGILAIKEIIEYSHVTRVPMMPDHLRGVINLRGAVVPVVDLPVRFGRGAGSVTKRTCVVIIEIPLNSGARRDVGIVVDSVDSVIDIPAADIEPPPAFGTQITSDFIRGMGKVNGKFVILLEVSFVLGVEEMALLQESAQPTEHAA